MEELKDMNEGQIIEKRPKFLWVIAILSFTNIALTVLTSVVGIITGKPNADELEAAKLQFAQSQEQLANLASTEKVDMSYWSGILTKLAIMTDNMYANFTLYNSLILMVAILALIAVYLMFTGRKLGFHLYIAYCFLYVIQSYFFTTPKDVPTFIIILNVLYGGLWVFLYSRSLKWMK